MFLEANMKAFVIRSAASALSLFLPAAPIQRPSPPAGAGQHAIIALEHRWLASEDDPSALESILADDFIHVLPSGLVTKAEQLQFMREHPVRRRGQRHFEDLRVRVYGSAAIANGIVATTLPDGMVQRTAFTDVFAFREGEWQAVNAQELPLAR